MNEPSVGDLRVWHIPQIPGKPFYVPVDSISEGKKVIGILADYDMFQYKNNIKPDYANMSGLERFEMDEEDADWFDVEEEEEF